MSEKNPLICVIDDELLIRECLSSLLRSAGLKVQTFSSAEEFLSNPPVEVVGCLIVDVQLPGMGGFDLQQELARSDAQIPIIFITGYADIPMSVLAIKAGAIEYLAKPFSDEDLLSAIDQAIDFGRRIELSKVSRLKSYPILKTNCPAKSASRA